MLDVAHQYQNGMVVAALLALAIEIELENLQEVQVGLGVEHSVNDGVSHHVFKGKLTQQRSHNVFRLGQQFLGQEVHSFLGGVDDDEDIDEVVLGVVLRVIDDLCGQLAGEVVDVCLLGLLGIDYFDVRVVLHPVFELEQLHEAADVGLAQLLEVGECVSGEDELVDICGDGVEVSLQQEEDWQIVVECLDVLDLS